MSKGVGAQYQAACEHLVAAHAELDEARRLFQQCRDASKDQRNLLPFYQGICEELDKAGRWLHVVGRMLCLREH